MADVAVPLGRLKLRHRSGCSSSHSCLLVFFAAVLPMALDISIAFCTPPWHRLGRGARLPRRAVEGINSWREITKKMFKDEENEKFRAAALEKATNMPESFEEAVELAMSAALDAVKAGNTLQTMRFTMEGLGGDDEISEAIEFSEQLARGLARSNGIDNVHLLLSSAEVLAEWTSRWDTFPSSVTLGNMQESKPAPSASIIVVAAPTDAELPALLGFIEARGQTPIILVNPLLSENVAFSKEPTPTFHMEQVDLREDLEDDSLNPAVITRVWPRAFSVWEDNPDDPLGIEGYVLLNVNDKSPPPLEIVAKMLYASQADFRQRNNWNKR